MSGTNPKTGFPDLPIDGSDDGDNRDLLGLDQHAAALAGFIEMCSTPMTIGIQGDWGSGKTSLMNFVRTRLGNERALNIWFNTWQYSQFGNEAQLASSMLINLMQKIKSEGKPSKQVWHNVSRFIRSVVQASALEKGGLSLTGKSLLDAVEGRGDLDDAGLFERMKEDFAEVIKDVLGQGKGEQKRDRVVIYIDDLDRLAPSKAVELLEAAKNLIDVEGCVFVLAIDYDVVIRGLRQRKGYDSGDFRESEGKNFFDKIIQVPYRMPVERYTTQNFLKSHFERVYGKLSDYASTFFEDSANELIHLSVGNNPRGLKRALNIHALFSHLMRIGREDEVGDDERLVTFVLACIQVALPSMYSLLAKRRSPFFTLVSLRTREVYGLLDRDDEAEEFEQVATRISEEMSKLREQPDDDDDDGDDVKQATDELRLLAGDLRRFVSASDEGAQKRVRRLAAIALAAIDINGNGSYSQQELDALDTALSVTSTTSVEGEKVEEVEETTVRMRRNVGFKELSDSMPVFAKRPKLVFWDRVTEEYDVNFKRTPDYEASVSRLHIIVDGASVRIKEETLRILGLREDRGDREMTAMERSGRINAAAYWVVEGDKDERTVAMLREEWKAMQGREVDMRNPAERDAYEMRILAYLRSCEGNLVPARQIQEQVGGTLTQTRRALNHLIERRKVTYEGRARGTRYGVIV
ncbi:KAP family P-loop NTPase fold protein [Paraliomyxa miuraensis]|uniref:KAP family P-loop NTPase fold protein n=1 Tax=Paraliomyxa miuraensis TaxID=376150 RepID=UPI0022599D0E|nr:P-loop NTPase fold protein [Paraliomyxa miuraensis]MCX4247392.1 KAP family NTPase [Paraliomyxa miuraensis]